MKKFAIVTRDDAESVRISKEIQKHLFNNGMSYAENDPEVVCIIGGDGTFLSAIHKYIRILDRVVFTGINTGTLGFFTDYTQNEVEAYLNDILNEEPEIEEKSLLKIVLSGKNDRTYLAVNEMRIENIIRTQGIDVYINDKKLETFRGTGLCLCTQAGSTAYNRSLKGAVVEPGLDIMELSEVTGIHHSLYRSLNAPLILKGDNTVRMAADYDESAILCFDRYAVNLKGTTAVICSLSDKKARLAHYRPIDYIERLYHLF